MTAPYVERTVKKIESEPDRLTRSLMRVELACYWARVGEFQRAEEMRTELRSEFGDGKSPRISIMIMCLEGLLLYFRDLGVGAKDRLDRARLLSGAIQDPGLVAFTSAWQAHIAFNRDAFESMAAAADDCLASASEQDTSALSRITLVMGDLFAYLRDRPISQVWYSAARDFATKLGDHASVGAITYNRAALRVFELRMRDIATKSGESELDLVDGEVRSAVNYQALAELRSLDHLLGSAQVGASILRQQFSLALTQASSLLQSGVVRAQTPQHSLLLADSAMCSAVTGDRATANDLLKQCDLIDLKLFPSDEQALFLSQVDRTTSLLGCPSIQPARVRSVTELIDDVDTSLTRLRSEMSRFAVVPYVIQRALAAR